MDILEDLRTTTFSNNEAFFKKAACEIEQLRTENAALKEQITNAKYNYLGAMADCKQYEETIEQQAEAIRVKNEALFTAYTTFTEYAQIHSAKQPPDTRKSAFNFDRANQMNAATTIQPSPETLQARDERVAGACAKVCIEQSEGIARAAPVRDCSESSVRESAFRIRNGAWERHL